MSFEEMHRKLSYPLISFDMLLKIYEYIFLFSYIFVNRNIITLPNTRYVEALFKRSSEHTNDFGLIVYDLVDKKFVRQANIVSFIMNI